MKKKKNQGKNHKKHVDKLNSVYEVINILEKQERMMKKPYTKQ